MITIQGTLRFSSGKRSRPCAWLLPSFPILWGRGNKESRKRGEKVRRGRGGVGREGGGTPGGRRGLLSGGKDFFLI